MLSKFFIPLRSFIIYNVYLFKKKKKSVDIWCILQVFTLLVYAISFKILKIMALQNT